MNLNQREEKLQEIRTLFLEAEYARFKLLKEIFTPLELLNSDPLVLVKLIYQRLSLEKNTFNEASFRRWLRRNRNKQQQPKSKDVSAINARPHEQETFQFTDPATITKSKDPIIKFA